MRKEVETEFNRSGVLRVGRTIWFFDEIAAFSCMEAMRHITQLTIESKLKPITLIINSPGGCCSDGFALYDWMRMCEAPIITVGTGMVASMGFIIYLAGDKRISTPTARYLNHQVWTEIVGKATDINIEKQEIDKLESLSINLVSERTGMTPAVIKKAIKVGDHYYSAVDAKKYGIVHEIINYIPKEIPKLK